MEDSAKNRIRMKILEVLRNSDDMLREFRRRIENKYVIVFVGSTRSGKSTLTNFITGAPLVAFKDQNMFRIERSDKMNPIMDFSIGHGTLSHTTVPSVVEMTNMPDTVIIDAPGFDDNRGPVQEITNALYINQIKHSKGARFVLVSDINTVTNDNVNSFIYFIDLVHTMIPDFTKLEDSVSIVFTKASYEYDPTNIAELLDEKILKEHELRCKKDLIAHFVKRPDLIGVLKMPSAIGILTEDININIEGAIFKRCSPVNVADLKFGISKSAMVILLDTYLQFNDVVIALKATFRNFTTEALAKFRNLSNANVFLLDENQLYGNTNPLSIMMRFEEFLNDPETLNVHTSEIPDSLRDLYVDKVNEITNKLRRIGVGETGEPIDSAIVFAEIRRKLEYVACIEKVVEKDDQSRTILTNYQKQTDEYRKEIEKVCDILNEEQVVRKNLKFGIEAAREIKAKISRIDQAYIFGSYKHELATMTAELQEYQYFLKQILCNVQMRPDLQRNLQREVHNVNSIFHDVQNLLDLINQNLEARKREVFIKYVPAPVSTMIPAALLYLSFGYMHKNVYLAAGSFLIFASLCFKSASVRANTSRICKRWNQNRKIVAFNAPTILNGFVQQFRNKEPYRNKYVRQH